MNCEHYSRCKAIDHTASECVCPKMSDCSPRKDEVCGSDGKTYPNDCAVRVEACTKGMDISVANLGPCGKFKALITCRYYRKIYDYQLFYDSLSASSR